MDSIEQKPGSATRNKLTSSDLENSISKLAAFLEEEIIGEERATSVFNPANNSTSTIKNGSCFWSCLKASETSLYVL